MKIIIQPNPHKKIDDTVERSCTLIRCNDHGDDHETKLWFQFEKFTDLPEQNDCDAYLLAVLMDAMHEGRNIEVKGAVSKELLSNLIEYQGAWAKMEPDVYQSVKIDVDKIRNNNANDKDKGTICAFSGGVDAVFSAWVHSQGKMSYRSNNIKLCAIVHGFDIPLAENNAFESAFKRSQLILNDVQLPLYKVRTNYREVAKVSWGHAHGTALSASLCNFKNVANSCLFGSAEAYGNLVLPRGTSPMTDHLLSSGEFNVIHDGATHSRTEKVREIADWPLALSNLRVCWEGDLKDRNCGLCEKCVRTRLNFLAVGEKIPSCFPDSQILDDIKPIKLKSEVAKAEWSEIYDYALKNNINEKWVAAVRKKVGYGVIEINKEAITFNWRASMNLLLPEDSKRRNLVKSIFRKCKR